MMKMSQNLDEHKVATLVSQQPFNHFVSLKNQMFGNQTLFGKSIKTELELSSISAPYELKELDLERVTENNHSSCVQRNSRDSSSGGNESTLSAGSTKTQNGKILSDVPEVIDLESDDDDDEIQVIEPPHQAHVTKHKLFFQTLFDAQQPIALSKIVSEIPKMLSNDLGSIKNGRPSSKLLASIFISQVPDNFDVNNLANSDKAEVVDEDFMEGVQELTPEIAELNDNSVVSVMENLNNESENDPFYCNFKPQFASTPFYTEIFGDAKVLNEHVPEYFASGSQFESILSPQGKDSSSNNNNKELLLNSSKDTFLNSVSNVLEDENWLPQETMAAQMSDSEMVKSVDQFINYDEQENWSLEVDVEYFRTSHFFTAFSEMIKDLEPQDDSPIMGPKIAPIEPFLSFAAEEFVDFVEPSKEELMKKRQFDDDFNSIDPSNVFKKHKTCLDQDLILSESDKTDKKKKSLKKDQNIEADEEKKRDRRARTEIVNLLCTKENCNCVVSNWIQLNQHLWAAHGIKRFQCPIEPCEYSCEFKLDMESHIRSNHADISQWSCRHCSHKFGNYSSTLSHFKNHHQTGTFKCLFEGCDLTETTLNTLLRHQYLVHKRNAPSGPTKSRLACTIEGCGKYFVTQDNLAQHLRWHEDGGGRLHCNECDKTFAQLKTLRAHVFAHRGLKQFRCGWPECTFDSTYRGQLAKHITQSHFGAGNLTGEDGKKVDEYIKVLALDDYYNIKSAPQ